MKMRSVRKLRENTCVNKCAHRHAHAHNTFNCIYIYIEGGREAERGERERENINAHIPESTRSQLPGRHFLAGNGPKCELSVSIGNLCGTVQHIARTHTNTNN